jgi:starch synthase
MDKRLSGMLKAKNMEALPSVLMVAAECAPFAKTGGLADVAGTLSRALKGLGFDVRLMLPYHRVIKEKYAGQVKHLASFSVQLGWRSQYAGVELLDWDGLPVYLIDNEFYFGNWIYSGGSFEGEQYAFFSRAALEALPIIGFEPDILHANDWHTAMIPMLVKTQYQGRPQGSCKTLLAMHSLMYQGKFDFGFVSELLGIDSCYNQPDYIEHYGAASFMKAGVVFADKLVTVSTTYAQEIRTPYFGEGLDGILNARADDLVGILNGIDAKAFNPEKDDKIAENYSVKAPEGKQACKQALCTELELDANAPLVCMVTRMTKQKGLDLVLRVFDEMMQQGISFAMLGTGHAEYEDFFRDAERRYPGRVRALLRFDDALSHRIYAGGDFLLMPSLFEPCGISQMIAMRYGTLPIVRATGGLKDTVKPYNEFTSEGNGFSFDSYNAHDMLGTLRYALKIYEDKEALSALRRAAMKQDLSFKKSAKAYASLYVAMMPTKELETPAN